MSVKLLTEHHLEFLRLTGGCKGSSKSTVVKMPHCLKSRVTAHVAFAVITAERREAIVNAFYNQNIPFNTLYYRTFIYEWMSRCGCVGDHINVFISTQALVMGAPLNHLNGNTQNMFSTRTKETSKFHVEQDNSV